MIRKPPNWRKNLAKSNRLPKLFESEEVAAVIKKAQKEYAYWDKFRYYPLPKGFSAEEIWTYLKLTRNSQRENIPMLSKNGSSFGYILTNTLQERLSYIDTHGAGILASEQAKPSTKQKEQLIISGLSEEAIASSQIEGANTSRKVAKAMIASKRKAHTKDEQMIINNYMVMQRLSDLSELPLSFDILIEIQKIITHKTLDNEKDVGRFREKNDEIIVTSSVEGKIVFIPPDASVLKKELRKLINYANSDEKDSDFVHPIIKASILHFWLAYLHPFIDGNGRTARALFYWYLLKKDYWLFQYLSISRVIKQSRGQYDLAFLYTEYDENDLTYFLLFITAITQRAIEQFRLHFKRKFEEIEKLNKIADKLKKFNSRQVTLLNYLNQHKNDMIEINNHISKHQITYETARTDLMTLVKEGYLTKMKRGKKFIFLPCSKEIKNLLTQNK